MYWDRPAIRPLWAFIIIIVHYFTVLSLVITSLSVFLIWGITNSAAVVGVAALFNACMLSVFGAITLIVANVYEPGVR